MEPNKGLYGHRTLSDLGSEKVTDQTPVRYVTSRVKKIKDKERN